MRFDRPISYNGWTSSLTRSAGGAPASGYLFKSVDPSRVDAVGYIDKRAVQDGVDAGDTYLSQRNFGAIVVVYGSTWGDFWDKAQSLFAAFSPTLAYNADTANAGFLPFDFIQPTADTANWPIGTYPYGIPMCYYLRPTTGPLYSLDRDEVGGDASLGLAKAFSLNLVARDPRKYAQSTVVTALTTTAQALTYRGDYPTFPIITFALSATGHSALTFTVASRAVVLDVSSYTSGSFTLDYATRTLTRNGVVISGRITSADFAQVSSGVSASRTNATGLSSSTLTHREAWA